MTEYLDPNLKCNIIALPDVTYSSNALNLNRAIHEKHKQKQVLDNDNDDDMNDIKVSDESKQNASVFQEHLLNAQSHKYFMCIQDGNEQDDHCKNSNTYHLIDLNNNYTNNQHQQQDEYFPPHREISSKGKFTYTLYNI